MIWIYSSESIDGIAGAAIVLRHASLSRFPARFGGFVHQDSLVFELEGIVNEPRKSLFFLDVNIENSHSEVIEQVSKKHALLYWSSHDTQCIIPRVKIFDIAATES